MKMTLLDYIKNPSGDSTMTQRGLYQNFYAKKFDALLLRENGRLDHTLYNNGDEYLIHFKIPSETIENFYYDVVFQFIPKDNNARSSPNLNNYYTKFFSNDPAFIFTYAHVFLKEGLLVDDLASKIGAKATKEAPKETNPKKIIGYVKTFYFAYLFMKAKGLFNKVVFRGNGKKYFKTPFVLSIESAQSKVDKRIELQKEKSKRSRVERTLKNTTAPNRKIAGTHIASTRRVSTTKSIRSVRKTKLSKRK